MDISWQNYRFLFKNKNSYICNNSFTYDAMKRCLCIILLLAMMTSSAEAQHRRGRGYRFQGGTVYKGDTIDHYSLTPIYIFDKPIDLRRYQKLVAAVKRVYPLAQVANAKLAEAEAGLQNLDKNEQQAYIKQCYKAIIDEYTPVVKRMSRTQGKVLIKLIDRQTEHTAFEIIKEFRGGFVASFWQGIGKIFGHDLKAEYDKENEDKLLEQIIIYYEAGLL